MNLTELVHALTVAQLDDAQICNTTGLTRHGLAIVREREEYIALGAVTPVGG